MKVSPQIKRVFWLLLTSLFLLVFSSVLGQGNADSQIGISNSGNTSSIDRKPESSSVKNQNNLVVWRVNEDEPDQACATIDFEGVGDQSPIPEFDGITSPDWLGIIDEDAGGSGNFANEPSPSTIAFWLGGATGTGSSRDILFEEPVATVEFYYSSFVETVLEAYDEDNNLLATVTGPSNFGQGPGGDPNGQYNQWDLLKLEVPANDIVRINVSGAVNQTGIDDLRVCKKIKINSVEFTQAIQELQSLEDLLADLENDSSPPVPIVAEKPLALRIYMEEVNTTTTVKFQLSGVDSQEKTVQLQPNCTPEQSRLQANQCQSVDFFFTPPSGSWSATIKSLDMNDEEIESHTFTIDSVDAEPLVLGAVQICDTLDASGSWQCSTNYHTRLSQLMVLLRKISPTAEVRIVDTGEIIRRDINTYDADGNNTIDNQESAQWWVDTAEDVGDLYSIFDSINDLLGLEDRVYYGMVRPNIPGTILGIANDIPSQGALSLMTATDLGQDVSQDTVAHEVFHTLGRRHTNTAVPVGGAPNSAPGCHWARDLNSDWPFANNRIQSSNALEVGFDVSRKVAFDPQTTFDIMSYCVPVWISPHTYVRMLETELFRSLGDNNYTTESEVNDFWLVSGNIFTNTVEFDPLVVLNTSGSTEEQSGDYVLQLLDTDSAVLFSRNFAPAEAHTRIQAGGEDVEGDLFFAELIPYFQEATKISILDSNSIEIGNIDIVGVAPVVNITFPIGNDELNGIQTLTWEVDDTDSTNHTFWVQYSAEDGAEGSWQTLAFNLNESELIVDFDQLSGAEDSAVIRVVATDGVNSAFDTSASFSVPKKLPSSEVIFPDPNTVFQKGQLVWLQGEIYDRDQGFLRGSDLLWSSNVDGALGTDNSLPITKLSEGRHTITFEATDEDGNATSSSIDILVDGTTPTLSSNVFIDNSPASCVIVTASASDETNGSGLNRFEYSFDGGISWTDYEGAFLVPGTGFFHFIIRASDRAGNVAVEDDRFFIDTECSREITTTYLPLVSIPPVTAPDLIVESVSFEEDSIQVTIKNQGSAPIEKDSSFWIDLYVDPSPPPSELNQIWPLLSNYGAAWGITADALPLSPGGVLTLTLGDNYYWESFSDLPSSLNPSSNIYVHVDSASIETDYGGVLETHEIIDSDYNNIFGPVSPTMFQVRELQRFEPMTRSLNGMPTRLQ